MPHIDQQSHLRAAAAAIALLLTLVLAACGGSSGAGSSSSSNAAVASAATTAPTTSAPPTTSNAPSKTNSTATTAAPRPKAAAKTPTNATAPSPTEGAGNAHAPALEKKKLARLNAGVAALRACMRRKGMTIPKSSGTSQSAYTEALKQCIPSLNIHISPGGLPANGRGAKSLPKFIACMRAQGVNLPAPTASANGPVLNTAGVNTGEAKFKTALLACKANLPGLSELIAGSIGGHVGGATP